MRVEIRKRTGVDRAGVTAPVGSPSYGITEAYSDDCFESPARFFVVSPEHPKLGQWAQSSTLKYSQPPPAHYVSSPCLDETIVFPAARRRPRTACSSAVNRGHALGITLVTTSTRSNGKSSRVRQRVESGRAKRPISPMGSMSPDSDAPPVSSIQGLRGSQRIDTPVSGRVSIIIVSLACE